jgi:hypothetical protein
MNKFLNSDWLRARVQFCRNTVQKMKYSANFLIFLVFLIFYFSNFIISKCAYARTCIIFSCILLISNSMVSRAIWKDIHSWVSQRLQIALVLRIRAIMIVFEKLTRACFFSKLHSKPYYLWLLKYQYLTRKISIRYDEYLRMNEIYHADTQVRRFCAR